MITVTPTRWAEFVGWAEQIYSELDMFDEIETSYKLTVAERLRVARESLDDEEGWLAALRRAFSGPNNLTSFYAHSPYLDWCAHEPKQARQGLRWIWDESKSPASAIRGFTNRLPLTALSGPGQRLSIASFLFFGRDPEAFPVYRARPVAAAYRLVGHESRVHDNDLGGRYGEWLEFLDRMKRELHMRGMELRHRLDAQGLSWCVTDGTPTRWVGSDQEAALEAFRQRAA